jgi:hypothetical protein
MNLQTIKPRAQWKDNDYGRYCVVTFSDMPGEYHARTLEEALRRAHLVRLLCMTSLKAAMGSGRRDA